MSDERDDTPAPAAGPEEHATAEAPEEPTRPMQMSEAFDDEE